MKNLLKLLIIAGTCHSLVIEAKVPETTLINQTNTPALLDGHCGSDEWEAATKIEHPASATVYVMHDNQYFYICAKGNEGELTVLDLYIQNTETEKLHKFHLSAQMGEAILEDNDWKNVGTWQLKDWAGFWVPYFGTRDTDNGKAPKFYSDAHRQVQIARKKFPGNTWKMMFTVSIRRDGNWLNILFPEKAKDNDETTWSTFSFSENNERAK